MPTYKLKYFNIRGRAELVRWLFIHSGVKYEDVRLNSNDWKTEKPNWDDFPFHQMPVLDVIDDDGKRTVVAQSYAIARYVANACGLAGNSPLEIARGDMLNEHIFEALQQLPWTETDKEKKLQLAKEAINGPIKENFKLLEKFVLDSGHLVGDDFTLADFSFASACEFYTPTCPDVLEDTPKLKALNDRVRSSPKIAEWISARPVTEV